MKKNQSLFLCITLLLPFIFIMCDDDLSESTPPEERDIQFRDLVSLDKDTTFKKGPYLMNCTQTSIVIMWETETESTSLVEYGLTDSYDFSKDETEPAIIHEVLLENLNPETIYHYRVTSENKTTMDLQFMTSVKSDTPFRFTAISDTHVGYDINSQIYETMITQSPFFILHCGDMVNEGMSYDQWQESFSNPLRKIAHYVPLFLAIGNHEADTHYFYDYVSYPYTENNYSFVYGNTFFLVLDTNFSGLKLVNTETLEWLNKELISDACKNATWRIAAFHEPPWTESWGTSCYFDGEEWEREILIPLLEDADFHMVFNGDMHGYERGYLNGITYIITGGGGGGLDGNCTEFDHILLSEYVHHHCQIDIKGKLLDFKAFDLDGKIIDSFTLDQRDE